MDILIFPHTKYADIKFPTFYQISSFISNPASKIIQTNTSSVILRKHPRFSIYHESNIGLYNHCTQGSGPVSNKVMKICYDNLTEIFFGMANSLGEERRARLRLYKVKECLITSIWFVTKKWRQRESVLG